MKILSALFAVAMLCALFVPPVVQSLCSDDAYVLLFELEDERDVEDSEDVDVKDAQEKLFYEPSFLLASEFNVSGTIRLLNLPEARLGLNLLGVDTPPPERA